MYLAFLALLYFSPWQLVSKSVNPSFNGSRSTSCLAWERGVAAGTRGNGVRDTPKKQKLLTGRRIFQLYRIQFSNTGVDGGLYTRLSQLIWHLQKLPIQSSRRFQHDLTIARPCYVTETEYSPRFHEIPRVSISWINAFPWSSNRNDKFFGNTLRCILEYEPNNYIIHIRSANIPRNS